MKQFIEKYFVSKTLKTHIQLLRYFFVGGTAAIFDVGGLYFLNKILEVNYLIAAPISFLAGLLVNYALSIFWVFALRTRNITIELSVFLITGIVGLLLNQLIIWFLVDIASTPVMVGKFISLFIVFFWHFFSRKISLFNRKS